MITYKQLKICQRLGFDTSFINFSHVYFDNEKDMIDFAAMGNVGNIKWENIEPLIDKNVFKEIKVPIELRKYIEKYNVAPPYPNIFNTNRTKGKVFNALFSYNKKDKLNIFSILKNWDYKNLLPFADDVSGDIICIDLEDNTIKLVRHETGKIEFISNSLDKFMNSLYG